jgi:outer membrane protein assembly factor BamB
MSRLIIRYPNNVIKEVDFNKPKFKIGTADDNDLVLEDDGVSSYQAEIDTDDGAYSIVDVSEPKNTTVNGKPIERVNLNYGDRINFGPVIGLFYPSKISKMPDKTKMIIFISAGAAVIFFSIFFILFTTNRRLESVFPEQIGEVTVTEQTSETYIGREIDAGQQRQPFFGKQKDQGRAESSEKRSFFGRRKQTEALKFPEVDIEDIKNRQSVAIPRGLKGLFFKKQRVYVERSRFPQEGAEVAEGSSQGAETVLEEPGALFEEYTVPEGGEEIPGQEMQPGAQPYEEFYEESFPEEKNLLTRIISPFKKLFFRESPTQTTEEFPSEEEIFESFLPEGQPDTGNVERSITPSPGDIDRVAESLSVFNKTGTEITESFGFNEKPVYSEDELKQFQTLDILSSVPLSQVETFNARSVWLFSGGYDEGDSVIRSGTVGRIDDDRFYDFVFGTKNGQLFALSGSSGTEIFSQQHEKPFYEPIVVNLNGDRRDDILLTFEDGDIVSYTTGLEQIWLHEGLDKITSLPLLIDVNSDGTEDIVYTTLGMDIVALDGRSGFEIWRFFDAESETLHSPVGIKLNGDSVHDVVFCTNNGYLYALDGKTGWGLWTTNITGTPAGGCAVGDLDGDGTKDIVALTRNGILSGFGKDGKPLFTSELNKEYRTPPSIGDVDGDGNVEIVLLDCNGTLRALEGRSRREKWSYTAENETSLGRVALADVNYDGGLDAVYATVSGTLLTVNGKTGLLLGVFNYGDYVLTTPIIADMNGDRIYEIGAVSYSGNVSAVRLTGEERKLFAFRKSEWTSINQNARNTGFSALSFSLLFWN